MEQRVRRLPGANRGAGPACARYAWTTQLLLHRGFRGVYRLGHRAPSVEARFLAAVLACGPGAVLSGLAAAWLYGLIGGRIPSPEVTAPTTRVHTGVVTRRVRRIDRRDIGHHRGIPTTALPRTLVDVAARLSVGDLARAVHEAEVRHRVQPAAIGDALARLHRPKGAAHLRSILHGDHPLTLGRLERGFLARVKAERLPLPQTNARIERGYVDCRWPERRLTVELDSFRFHHSRHAWERDRRRDREARARGDEHRRYTWSDVFEHRSAMLSELRLLL